MVKEANVQEVERLRESFDGASSAMFADFRGLKAEEITELRKELRVSNSRMKVVKNTLARLAVKDTPWEAANDIFSGPVSVMFSYGEDIGAPAKALVKFAKDHENLKILGGVVEGSLLDTDGVKRLADIPPKPVVQSMLLGVLQAPAKNLLGAFEGVGRKFLYALNAIAEKKKEQGES